MKKRWLSVLLTCCMVLTLLPVAALATEDTTTGVATEVTSLKDLTDALANSANAVVKLTRDITVEESLTVSRAVTLDLNGHVLDKAGSGSVIKVDSGGDLTLTDSDTGNQTHYFTKDPSGLWTLADTETVNFVTGGVIAGGTGTDGYGGGVYVAGGGKFTMSGGNIAGCVVQTSNGFAFGGGVYVATGGTFTMSGGSIVDCKASTKNGTAMGGGIRNDGTTTLSGTAKIRDCQATSSGGGISGGGISDGGTNTNPSTLNISGDVEITGCTANGTANAMTVMKNSTISGGTFDGTVANYGTITGGTFNGQVTNGSGGTITGGTFTVGITGTPALATGSGTEADPYQISTAAGLKWFRDVVNGANGQTKNLGACAELTADIDLENEAWTPIGNASDYDYGDTKAYSGIFDGGGHTISGLNVKGDFWHAGLFGLISGATIQDLSIYGSMTGSYFHFGSIAGTAKEDSTIKNCSSHCNVTNTRGTYAGGVVGMLFPNATVIDCYNTGAIHQGFSNASHPETGGIAGRNSGTIRNCYNVGSVSCDDKTCLGSIAGLVPSWSSIGTVENCYYLDGTGLNAVGDKGERSSITKTEPKTAEEFADGTVLKLLIGDRTDSPWDSACKYVTEAGRTLPVFQGQGDEHTHTWGAWTSNGDGTRTRTCACGATETTRYSSGGSHRTTYTIQATAGANGSVSPSGSVSVREGRDQTFTFAPDRGYAVADVKIDGESIGAVTSYTFENVRKAHTVAVTFAKTSAFTDVPAGSYYEDAVAWAVANGITTGTDAAHFSPDGSCTRAQAVTFLWRAAGSPAPESTAMPYTDVPAGSYYHDAVLWAVEQGITKGTSDTTFSPDATCTRAQIVTFLWRAEKAPAAGDEAQPFTDVAADAYYADAVLWAVENGITKGTTDTTFGPNDDCTRAQIVTFLWRSMT